MGGFPNKKARACARAFLFEYQSALFGKSGAHSAVIRRGPFRCGHAEQEEFADLPSHYILMRSGQHLIADALFAGDIQGSGIDRLAADQFGVVLLVTGI